MTTALEEARRLLERLTPLKRDCGRICGARCCKSLEGEETGMLLFPGEEDCVKDLPGWRTAPGAGGTLVFCPGRCRREERPLSCRLFPLLPLLRDGEVTVRVDERAGSVCPLAGSGLRGMDPDFVRAVREAGEWLARDPETAVFLEKMTEEQEEWRKLRREWGR